MANDLRKIKKYIYNHDKIEIILEALGCEHISERGNRYEAQLPERFNSNNRRSVQVKKTEFLSVNIRSRGIKGDIYSLVSYILHDCVIQEDMQRDLPKAKKFIVDTVGCHDLVGEKKTNTVDCLGWLRDIKKRRTKIIDLNEIEPNEELEEEILRDYQIAPMPWWRNEGMKDWVQREFEVGFDLQSQRIIFPIRNKEGKLIGVKGRTVVDHDMKYLYLHPCNKSIELFNLHRALPFIRETGRVFVFESEKSTMYATQHGYPESVAICGDDLDAVQAQLLKSLGKDIQIIFSMDKDKEVDFIYKQCKKVTRRDVYAMMDVNGLLGEKDSPVDKGKEIWEQLVNENCYFIQGKDDYLEE